MNVRELRSLTSLDVSHNRLSGTIRSGVAKLRGLKSIRFDSNEFVGSIPKAICNLWKGQAAGSYVLVADCSGEVSCTCCTKCN